MSDELKTHAWAQNAPIRLITLLELDDGESTVLLCDSRERVISNGQQYEPFPFEFVLSEQTDERPPDATIRLDNTDRSVLAAILEADDTVEVVVNLVTDLDYDRIEFGPFRFRLKEISYDRQTVEITLRFDDRLQDRVPAQRFTSDNSPGLFP